MGNYYDKATTPRDVPLGVPKTQCSSELRVRSIRIGDGRQEECTFLQFDPTLNLFFRRRFFIYKPVNLICTPGVGDNVPLLCLFHGSYGSGVMSSVYCQFASGRAHAWQDVAYREGAILVFMESLPEPEPPALAISTSPAERETEKERRKELRTQHGFSATDYDGCWRAGPRDQDYIEAVIDHVIARYSIDSQRIYAIGHSNGGLFMSDVVLCSQRFAAVVNHMGGLEPQLTEAESAMLGDTLPRMLDQIPVSSHRKVPMLVMTAPCDDNRALCENAHREFSACRWPVSFWMYSLPDLQRHGFYIQSAEVAWGFCNQAHQLGCTPVVARSPVGIDEEQQARFTAFDWETFLRQRERPDAPSTAASSSSSSSSSTTSSPAAPVADTQVVASADEDTSSSSTTTTT